MKTKFLILVCTLLTSQSLFANTINICDRGVIGDKIAETVKAPDCSKVSSEDMAALKELKLENLHISLIPENAFQGLGSLMRLSLNYNQIVSFKSEIFKNLPMLLELSMDGNLISELPDNAFVEFENLQLISLAENKFTSVPKNIFPFIKFLNELNLESNQITKLPKGTFEGCPAGDLLLGDNQINYIDPLAFQNYDLFHLYLDNNKITSLPAGIFAGFENMEYLDLSNNPITKISKSDLGLLEYAHVDGVEVLP